MRDVMIDLETMGAGNDAAIVSIGAVFFDMHRGVLGEPFHRPVNLATSVKRGGTMDPGTVMWWVGQSQEARDAMRFSTYHIDVALAELRVWLTMQCRREDLLPWGNSARFDLGILSSAFERSDIEVPWEWWNERCYRTLRAQYPTIELDERSGTHHKADDDAIFQAKHLMKIVNTLRAKRQAVAA
jgi:exodeoxyribonuclease VIII